MKLLHKFRRDFGDADLKKQTVLDPENFLLVTPIIVAQLSIRFLNNIPAHDIDKLIDEFFLYQNINIDEFG